MMTVLVILALVSLILPYLMSWSKAWAIFGIWVACLASLLVYGIPVAVEYLQL